MNRLTPEQRADRDMSERTLSKEFDKLRKAAGWRAHGIRIGGERKAALRHGDIGFPDWFLARGRFPAASVHRAIAVELKDETGELSPDQVIWRDLLRAIPGIEWYLFRPSDLRTGRIAATLA